VGKSGSCRWSRAGMTPTECGVRRLPGGNSGAQPFEFNFARPVVRRASAAHHQPHHQTQAKGTD
jgi:hypothetical protein